MSSNVFKSTQLILSQPKNILVNQYIEAHKKLNIEIVNSEFAYTEDTAEDVSAQAGQILQETEEMVKELLATARNEAEMIIAEARDQAEQKRTDAFNQGYQDGQRKVEEEAVALRKDARNTIEAAYREKEKIIKSAEEEIITIASAIAKKIVFRELTTEPAIILDIVRDALQKVNNREELNLKVNPENIDIIINEQDELIRSTKGVKNMRVIADPIVPAGGCVIESADGTVDARIERQLAELEQSLMDVTDSD